MPNPELFLVKDEGIVEFGVLKRCRPHSEFHHESQSSSSSSSHDGEERGGAPPEDDGRKKFEESDATEASKESEDNSNYNNEKKRIPLGEFMAEEEDDGLRTPTSLEHKIPMTKECPPAPRRPKPPPSNKRKALPTRTASYQLHFWQDLDSFFSAHLHRKATKTRTQDHL